MSTPRCDPNLHIDCGEDGWAHLAAVIDCHDRELIVFEFSLRARAKKALIRWQ